MQRLTIAAAAIFACFGLTAVAAQDLSPPANNIGDGPSMPNIQLPDGWANPTTGGEGSYVNNGVQVEDQSTPTSAPAEDGANDEITEDGH
jgi:hypothetical protein